MAKVLLVDDDPDIRTMMGMILKREGYEVATAGKREEALDKLKEYKPSVILLDVLLSGADGRELCREIKANEATSHIPIIMFSGHPGAALKFESYGADDFIAKPISMDVLLNKLSKQTKEIE